MFLTIPLDGGWMKFQEKDLGKVYIQQSIFSGCRAGALNI